MGIRSRLRESPEATHPLFRYGMLVFIFVMFATTIKWHITLSPAYDGDPYRGYVALLLLLFNHLACAFKWPKRVATTLWILAGSWIVFSFFYFLYLSHTLYPSTPSLLSW